VVIIQYLQYIGNGYDIKRSYRVKRKKLWPKEESATSLIYRALHSSV
jgi:hypothetical protein